MLFVSITGVICLHREFVKILQSGQTYYWQSCKSCACNITYNAIPGVGNTATSKGLQRK
jgi:hypothetical protein